MSAVVRTSRSQFSSAFDAFAFNSSIWPGVNGSDASASAVSESPGSPSVVVLASGMVQSIF